MMFSVMSRISAVSYSLLKDGNRSQIRSNKNDSMYFNSYITFKRGIKNNSSVISSHGTIPSYHSFISHKEK